MNKEVVSQFSIIIPVYNEEAAVANVVSEILENYRGAEIIVVDDGSTDNTSNIIKKFADIKVITYKNNKGNGAAIKAGIGYSSKDIIVTIDADMTYSVKDISLLLSNVNGYDMVVGARIQKAAKLFPFHQKIAKCFIHLLLSFIFKQKIVDINSGLRLIRKNLAIKYFEIFPDGFSLHSNLTLAMLLDGYKIKFIPISYSKRIGKSKIKIISYTYNFVRDYWKILCRGNIRKNTVNNMTNRHYA